MSLDEFFGKNKGKVLCNSPNDITSGNFDSKKIDPEVFNIFSKNHITHTKNNICG